MEWTRSGHTKISVVANNAFILFATAILMTFNISLAFFVWYCQSVISESCQRCLYGFIPDCDCLFWAQHLPVSTSTVFLLISPILHLPNWSSSTIFLPTHCEVFLVFLTDGIAFDHIWCFFLTSMSHNWVLWRTEATHSKQKYSSMWWFTTEENWKLVHNILLPPPALFWNHSAVFCAWHYRAVATSETGFKAENVRRSQTDDSKYKRRGFNVKSAQQHAEQTCLHCSSSTYADLHDLFQ